MRLSLGILFFVQPGLFLNLGQCGYMQLMAVFKKNWEKSSIFLLFISFFQSVASMDWFIGIQFAFCMLKDAKVGRLGGLGGLVFGVARDNWYRVWHVITTWSDLWG